MKTILFPFLLLFSLGCLAQKTSIKGSAKSYEGEEIGLWTSNDYISGTQKELTYTVIDSSGSFGFEFNAKTILYVTLKIGKHTASMYVQPDAAYDVIISAPDSGTYQNPNIEHDVKIAIRQTGRTEINTLTMDYDKRFDDFLSADYKDFVRRTPQAKLDSFRLAMHEYYSTVSNPFFKGYIDYSIAAMEMNAKANDKKLYLRYIANKPVLYDHPEYMNFFNTFYRQKLQTFALSKKGDDLPFIINNRGSYPAAVAALRRNIYIPNDTIAELVLLKGLYESYYDGSFKKNGITAILRQISSDSRIAEHRHIAQDMLNSFSKLQKGVMAPFFELPDKGGVTHSLDELRAKKYVYVMFYDAGCSACLDQMKVIPSLEKVYGAKVEFVSISTDRTNAALQEFLAKNPKYNWTFLYDNSNGKLKKDYEISALPAYFLIGMDGKFIQVPAESPDEDIEQVLYDLTKAKSRLHGVGNKKN